MNKKEAVNLIISSLNPKILFAMFPEAKTLSKVKSKLKRFTVDSIVRILNEFKIKPYE